MVIHTSQNSPAPIAKSGLSHLSLVQEKNILNERYRILKELGSGMESVVYLAEDTRLGGKLRVVKRYKEHPGGSGNRELDILIKLNHPFIPALIDYLPPSYEHPGGCLVMDYIQGETVETRFRRSGCVMQEQAVLQLSIQVCGILEYLHGAGPEPIIYRDLKPNHLLLDHAGYVHLIDFGSSRSFKPQGALDTVQLGTIGFAAPEQYTLVQSDRRTDLYALGAMMHYLLSGGKTLHAAEPLEGSAGSRISKRTRKIIKRLLMYDREARYQSAGETRAELEAAARAEGGSLFRTLEAWRRQ